MKNKYCFWYGENKRARGLSKLESYCTGFKISMVMTTHRFMNKNYFILFRGSVFGEDRKDFKKG